MELKIKEQENRLLVAQISTERLPTSRHVNKPVENKKPLLVRTVCNMESEDKSDDFDTKFHEETMILADIHGSSKSPMNKKDEGMHESSQISGSEDPETKVRLAIKGAKIKDPRLVFIGKTEGISPVTSISQRNSFAMKSSDGSPDDIVNHMDQR